jgi:hypothetical protein
MNRLSRLGIAGLATTLSVSGGLGLTAGIAAAEVTAHPARSHFFPRQPAPSPPSDPMSEAQELGRQISELHDSWDSLTPEQRNQQIAQLQQQVTRVDKDIQTLPPDQRSGVEATLVPSVFQLGDLLRKAQSPNQPCFFPFCLPGL